MKKIDIIVPGEPFGKQRPKFSNHGGFAKATTPPETVNYENLVKLVYMEKYNEIMFDEDEPIKIVINAYKTPPSSGTSKKKRLMMLNGDIRPTKKPDWDNIAKIIGDALNKIAYPDDKQIVEATIRKFYAETPRVEIEIESLRKEEE